MGAVYKKELHGYFTGFTGYILLAVMLAFMGIYTMTYCLSYQYSAFEFVYGNTVFVLLLFVPILTMRMFAEEKKQGTDRLLYSLPLKMSEIILGKYFAALTVLCIPCLITGIYPLILSRFGNINFKLVYIAMLGFFLLGAALTAVCMFISLLTENQIVAALVSFVVLLLNYFMKSLTNYIPSTLIASTIILVVLVIIIGIIVWAVTKNGVLADIVAIVLLMALIAIRLIRAELIQGILPKILGKIELFEQYFDIVYGSLDISTIVLYISVIVLFCVLSIQVLERRRWA